MISDGNAKSSKDVVESCNDNVSDSEISMLEKKNEIRGYILKLGSKFKVFYW